MIDRMTRQEKIGMLDTNGPPIKGLGMPGYNWWGEATSGVSSADPRIQTTKFAYPITTGMSFNRTLWFATGAQIGREARALMNVGASYSTFWAPVVNLAREPRWGRNIEVPSECPYQSGEYAVQFTRGVQESPDDPYHLQASACCKHFVANSMDGTAQRDGEVHDRFSVDSNVTTQDLIDSYMPSFQACVEEGRVSGLMCSYNAVNGVPSCANDWLLKKVARDEWGFDGYITADCDADLDVVATHHYRNHTPEQGVADVLHATTDVDCGTFVGTYAASALAKGTITMHDIEARLMNLFLVRLRLGHFDPVGPLQAIPTSDICSPYAVSLSHEGTTQSAALLKNLGGALPLDAAAVGKVAVIGPNANYSWGDTGYYGPNNLCGHKYWTAVDAVKKYVNHSNVETIAGIPTAMSPDASGIPKAVAMARAADTVVLVVGTDLKGAAEGHDATSITFTHAQLALIAQCTQASRKPVVVVLLTATPLDISPLLSNPKVGAVLHVGQPSVTIIGIADLLFGTVSPTGRTVQTFYPAAYQHQISIFDFNMRPGPSTFARPDCALPFGKGCPRGTNPGRTYRFFNAKPVVPFGFGLSYTRFTYTIVAAPPAVISIKPVHEMLKATADAGRTFPPLSVLKASLDAVQYSVNVTNVGGMDADDVVLGFLVPPGAGIDGVPLQQLYGFGRVHVKQGETKTVQLYPTLKDFTQVDGHGKRNAVTGNYTFRFGVAETASGGMGYTEHTLTVV